MIKIVFYKCRRLWLVKVGAFFVDIEISFYICKCKTMLSLLNKQTSGLLFFIAHTFRCGSMSIDLPLLYSIWRVISYY